MNLSSIALALQTAAGGATGPGDTGALTFHAIVRGVVSSLVYSGIGLVMFALAFVIINKSVPFSLRKEIEDDQNIALGIVIASVIIGIAMIVSAAVHG
jgi:uncharacterized membrane protein YjfL (UPF0719 family)